MKIYSFSTDSYQKLITGLRQTGYYFVKFVDEKIMVEEPQYVLMRHDVDFCLIDALQLAEIDHAEGVKSTFFFLLRSSFYNLIGHKEQRIISQIFELGHDIALHIDINIYENNYINGLNYEINSFKNCYPYSNTQIVSIHRPGNIKDLLNKDFPISHTYENRFFRDIGYISDSDGVWKYGHPFESTFYHKKQPFQLVTHPLWWIEKGRTPLGKLKNFLIREKTETIKKLKDALVIDVKLN